MTADKIITFWRNITKTLMGKDKGEDRENSLFAIAEYARRNPHRHKRTPLPNRPGSLPSDGDILDALAKSKRTADVTRDLRMFFAWRNAVIATEGKNAANLLVLFSAVRTFYRLGLNDSAHEVEDHLRTEFGWDDDSPLELQDVRRQTFKWSTEYDILSPSLRYGERPPRRDLDEDPEDDLSFMGEVNL